MFCGKCGNKLNEGAKFCPSCGNAITENSLNGNNQAAQAQVGNNQEPVQSNVVNNPGVVNPTNNGQVTNNFVNANQGMQESKANVFLVIVSFIIPLVGLILFISDKKNNPKNSKACGIAALVSFVLNIVLTVIVTFATLFFTLVGGTIDSEIDNATNDGLTTNRTTTTRSVSDNNQSSNGNTSVSDDWKSYTFSVNNKSLTLPVSYSELSTITGFKMQNDYEQMSLPNNKYTSVNLYTSSERLASYINIINRGDSSILYKEANVSRISQSKFQVETNNATKIVFPGNLSAGDKITEEEVIKKFGEPNNRREYSETVYYEYYADDSWSSRNYYKIEVLNGVIDELTLDSTN